MAASGEAAKSGRKRPGGAVRHTGKCGAPQQYGMVRSGDARWGSAPFSRNSAGFAVVLAVSCQLDTLCVATMWPDFTKRLRHCNRTFAISRQTNPKAVLGDSLVGRAAERSLCERNRVMARADRHAIY